jgi:hypothetical protein
MVELKTKITESGVLYIPKTVREAFTRNIRIIPNATAALFFPDHVDYEDVLASLKIITADVEHRIAMQEKEKRKTQ